VWKKQWLCACCYAVFSSPPFTHHIANKKRSSLALNCSPVYNNEYLNARIKNVNPSSLSEVENGKSPKYEENSGNLFVFVCSTPTLAYLSFCCAAILSILMQCSDDIQKSFLTKSLYNPGQSLLSLYYKLFVSLTTLLLLLLLLLQFSLLCCFSFRAPSFSKERILFHIYLSL
jgi:hypothetical protein